jgi:hypothetical protein
MKEYEQAADKQLQDALTAMKESMFMIEADTKQLSPVKTGTLKRSYVSDAFIKDDVITGVVGTPVEYAPYADWRKPHLTLAVDQNMEKVKRKISDALKEG